MGGGSVGLMSECYAVGKKGLSRPMRIAKSLNIWIRAMLLAHLTLCLHFVTYSKLWYFTGIYVISVSLNNYYVFVSTKKQRG
jgi:presenilin-like A22 family membrane protease